MVKLSEEMILARTRVSDMANVKKLNCWGSELSDVSVIRKLSNVEVLSLSVNNVTTLADMQHCKNLQELYIRKNSIQDLNEIAWLTDLTKLRNLWLEENPCVSKGPHGEELYRYTVIKTLPQLQKLDNVSITAEEMAESIRRGLDIVHPLDQDYSYNSYSEQTNSNGDYRYYDDDRRTSNGYSESRSQPRQQPIVDHQQQYSSSPSRRVSSQGFDSQSDTVSPQMSRIRSKNSPEDSQQGYRKMSHHNMGTSPASYTDEYGRRYSLQQDVSSTRRQTNEDSSVRRYQNGDYIDERAAVRRTNGGYDGYGSSYPSGQYSQKASYNCTNKNSNTVSSTTSSEHEDSNVKESSRSANISRASSASNLFKEKPNNGLSSTSASSSALNISGHNLPEETRNIVSQHYDQTYQQVNQQIESAHQLISQRQSTPERPYPRRPKNRNSNILSAVLCLIKELDAPSLEVAEMAVRCRMEELED